jgi:predicted MFS family arabinose efflux permease
VFWEGRSEHPMTPPRLVENRAFLGLNVATLMVYAGVSIMFFLLPFDLVDRRALSSTDAGMAFLPFTLGVGLLSGVFGGLADKIGARAMLIAGPAGAALAYVWMALGQEESLMLGVIVPMTLLGLSFAVLVAPLTASVMSSVDQTDEGLASGINNAASRIAQLAGVALAAGVASLESGYEVGLAVAAATSIGGAFTAAITPTPPASKAGGSEGA